MLDKVQKNSYRHWKIWWYYDLIVTDDKLPDDVTLKNVVILITCVIQNDYKSYLQ